VVDHREEFALVDRLAARGALVEVLGLVGGFTADPLAADALQLLAPGDEGLPVLFLFFDICGSRSAAWL
jgi:hypothetical protein